MKCNLFILTITLLSYICWKSKGFRQNLFCFQNVIYSYLKFKITTFMLAFLHKMRFGKSIKCTTLGVFMRKKTFRNDKIMCKLYIYNTYFTFRNVKNMYIQYYCIYNTYCKLHRFISFLKH